MFSWRLHTLHIFYRMVSYLLKEGIPLKAPEDYTASDFVFAEDRRNGYRSPRPLLCVMDAEYSTDSSISGHKRNKQYDGFCKLFRRKCTRLKVEPGPRQNATFSLPTSQLLFLLWQRAALRLLTLHCQTQALRCQRTKGASDTSTLDFRHVE